MPVGKVWRIDHMGFSPSAITNYKVGINVNGSTTLSYVPSYIDRNICPIWLKEGDNLQFYYNHTSGSAQSTNFLLSIVEFNIVP